MIPATNVKCFWSSIIWSLSTPVSSTLCFAIPLGIVPLGCVAVARTSMVVEEEMERTSSRLGVFVSWGPKMEIRYASRSGMR